MRNDTHWLRPWWVRAGTRRRRAGGILTSRRRGYFLPLRLEQLEQRTVLSASHFLASEQVVDQTATAAALDYDPSSLLVRFRRETALLAAADILSDSETGKAFPLVYGLRSIKLDAAADLEEALRIYRQRPDVLYAEPNYVQYVGAVPNDPRLGELWGLSNTGQLGGMPDADIDAPEAWDISTGSRNVVVAVIDTGVDYTHPDLAANMWINPGEIPGNGLDDDGNGYVDDVYGYDFVGAGDSDPMDDNNHGTHVAGTIGAAGNNALGVVGVNWNVQIMALKFLGASGSGSTADAIEAINYATMMRNRGVNIVLTSNSWGGGGVSQALQDAIAASGAANMLFVAAAGNAGRNNDITPSYPASYPLDNIISVAASDRSDNKASFSNWGETAVDLAAPGVSILSTTPGNSYSTLSGTSMATPHVAGVAALAYSVAGNVHYSVVRDAILSTVDPVSAFRTDGPTPVASGGRLNAHRTLQALGLIVSGSTPAAGSLVTAPPASYVIHFSHAVDPASVQPSDLTVNGLAASSVALNAENTTATFTFAVNPVGSQGLYTMQIAAGSIVQQADPARTIAPFSGSFRYDSLPMQVIATNPAPGGTFILDGPLVFDVTFNESVDPHSVQPADLVLSGISGAAASDAALLSGNTTIRFTISGVAAEGILTAAIASGAVSDPLGNPLPAAFSASYAVDALTLPIPTPLSARQPLGSLVYDRSAAGTISPAGDTDSFTLSLDPGQTISALVTPVNGDLRPAVEIRGPEGGVLGSAAAAAAGHKALLQTVAAADAGVYTITVSGAGGTSGPYGLRVTLNAALEEENSGGGSNNTLAAAQDLSSAAIPLGGGATRMAVMGTVGLVPLAAEDFEAGFLPASITPYSSNGFGRIRVMTPGAVGNTSGRALILDSSTFPNYVLNEAIYTVDLTGVTQAALSFSHVAFNDEIDPLPFEFFGHFDGDGVAISDDGNRWRRILNAPSNTSWTTATIDLAAAAAAAGMTLGPGFQIKFQQYDDFPLTSDGRGYDDILISTPDPQDTYQLTLGSGEMLSLALAVQGGGSLTLELLDAGGGPLATGKSGTANLAQVINRYLAPAAGTYYVRIRGEGHVPYNLVALRNAAFDAEANSTYLAAQDITGAGGVLGRISGTAELGRLFAYDATANQIREIDPLTGAVVRSFPSPVAASPGPDFGLATAGTTLLVAGSAAGPIFELDPDSGATIRTITNPGIAASGLAFLGEEIFVLTDAIAGRITVLDYVSGEVKRTITASMPVSEGLGASSNSLLATTGAALVQIDPLSGAATALGGLVGTNFSEGVGVIGDELFIADQNAIRVYDLATRAFKRSLTGLTDLEAIGADGATLRDEDWFAFSVTNTAAALRVETSTPLDGAGQPANTLDPRIELYDPAGVLVAAGSPLSDGRNEVIEYLPPAGGVYRVRVTAENGTSGEYFLMLGAGPAELPPFVVAATSPPDGAILLTAPATLTVDFSDLYLSTTVEASDLLIDGLAAATGMTLVDGDTVRFTLPPLAQGLHTLAIAGGAIRDIRGTPLSPFAATLTIDDTAPRVLATVPPPEETLAAGPISVQVTFSKPMKASNLTGDDFSLRGLIRNLNHAPISFSFNPGGTLLTLIYPALPEDRYLLTLRSGASGGPHFTDLGGTALDGEFSAAFPTGNGIAGGDFLLGFYLDAPAAEFAGPLAAKLPLGSLIYGGSAGGIIAPAGDTERLAIELDPGQTISVLASPDTAGLRPTLEVRGPSGALLGAATAPSAGSAVFLQTLPASTAGVHTITVGSDGGTIGQFTLQLTLNAALEDEDHGGTANNSLATAQNLDGAAISLGGNASRLAVLGTVTNGTPDPHDTYSLTLSPGDTLSVALTGQSAGQFSLELRDPSDALLASGRDGATNLTTTISDFAVTEQGTYFLRVSGDIDIPYSLVATRNAAFNFENNNTLIQAQAILSRQAAGEQWVLGHVGGTSDPAEVYKVHLAAGATLTVRSYTPGGGNGQFINRLDPRLRILSAGGNQVASDENSADGRNALVSFVNSGPAGEFYIEVAPTTLVPATSGEYLLEITGNTLTPPPFEVVAVSPPNGALLLAPPATYRVDFSDAIRATSLQAADLLIGGLPLAMGVTLVDSDTAEFLLPPLGGGTHALSLAAGVVEDVQGTPLVAYSSSFTIDLSTPRVTAASPALDAVLEPGPLTFTVTFSEPMNAANLDAADFTLWGRLRATAYAAESFSLNADGTILTLNFAGLPDDSYELTLSSGGSAFVGADGNALDGEFSGMLPSGDGTPGGDFVVSFSLDSTAETLPTPLSAVAPLGSLVYEASVTRALAFAGDEDRFTLPLDGGQTVTLLVTPSTPELQPRVQLRDPAGALVADTVAADAGQAAVAQTIPITAGGIYEIAVSSPQSGLGLYTLQVYLNAAAGLGDNTSLADAQDLEAAFLALLPPEPARRAAVVGSLAAGAAEQSFYSLSLPAGQQIAVALKHLAGSGAAIELTDADGQTLAAGVAGGGLVDELIANFVAPAAGTYVVVVSADAAVTYHLVVTREAVFESGTNGSFAAAQDVTASSVILGAVAAPLAEDWYAVDVASVVHTLRLTTATLGDGPHEFVNNLNPRLELYDPAGSLVASGLPLADGRNELLQYPPVVTGTYRVRVTGEGGTAGEYVLSKNFGPAISSLSASPIVEGGTASLSGVLSDPDAADAHTVVIDWGDGSETTTLQLAPGVTSFLATHAYADDDPTGTPSDEYSIIVTITDARGGAAMASLLLTVGNAPPQLTGLSSGSVDEGDMFTLTGTFRDDGLLDTHTIVIDWGEGEGMTTITTAGPNPPGTSLVSLGGGEWSFTASHVYLDDQPGGTSSDTYQITVSVTDDDAGSVVGQTSVTVHNVAPAATIVSVSEPRLEGTEIIAIGSAADAGSLDTLTYTWRVFRAGDVAPLAAVGDAPTFRFTPPDEGSYRIELTVSDDDGGTTTVEYAIDVLGVPPLAENLTLATDEDTEVDVFLVATDVVDDPLTFSIVAGPLHGTLSGTAPHLTFTPDADYHGSDSFTYRAHDGQLDSNLATVTITIQSVNDPPTFVAGSDVAARDDGGRQTLPWAASITAGPPDEAGQQLWFVIGASRGDLFWELPTIDPLTGELAFAPRPNTEGVAEITVRLEDDGGPLGGAAAFSEHRFQIVIAKPHRWHNSLPPYDPFGGPAGRGAMDVDADGQITPTDALLVTNYLNAPRSLFPILIAPDAPIADGAILPFLDVDADDHVTPTDALLIVNLLNARLGGPVGGEGTSGIDPLAADAFFGELASQPAGAAPRDSSLAALVAALMAEDSGQTLRRRRR